MKLYKLTDKNDRTYGGCQWGENVTVETSGKGDLCGNGFTHWYTDPLLAVMLNPIHGSFDLETAHLWEGEGEVVKNDCGLKVGCTKSTTVKRIDIPKVSPEQKVNFAILCTLEVYRDREFVQWAEAWLNGKDRTARAAEAAARAAGAAWAAWAARAASAAEAAARAAGAAWAARVAWAARAASAAGAAARAAEAAARAAGAAGVRRIDIDLIKLAKQAVS